MISRAAMLIGKARRRTPRSSPGAAGRLIGFLESVEERLDSGKVFAAPASVRTTTRSFASRVVHLLRAPGRR